MGWRSLSPQDLEVGYSPRLAVPDADAYIARYEALSEVARGRIGGRLDQVHGNGALATFDQHGADDGAARPALIFIHGGYWRALDKRQFSFALEPVVAAGGVGLNLNYDLCPAVTLDHVVAQVRGAVLHLWQNADALGIDRARLHLAGHSAGAHLAAMCLNHDWAASGLPAQPFKGALLISGIYDLEPVTHIAVNAEIGLDPAMARRNSPSGKPPAGRPDMLVAVGDAEPDPWIAQSSDYHAACRAAGIPADYWRLANLNHFSAVLPLADPRHPLTVALKRMMTLG